MINVSYNVTYVLQPWSLASRLSDKACRFVRPVGGAVVQSAGECLLLHRSNQTLQDDAAVLAPKVTNEKHRYRVIH